MEWLKSGGTSEDQSWISVADMMAGLMMIFLFIAIIYIRNIGQYFDAVRDDQQSICRDLTAEFLEEKELWNMTICENGIVIRFESDANFESNSAELSSEFEITLAKFYPRLMNIIWRHKESISELRVEGHTDSSVRRYDTLLTGYLYNTKLSQDRSRNVMAHSLMLEEISNSQDYLSWSFTHLTAHGMSSSELIMDGPIENFEKSRRVEFRLRTTAEEALVDLVGELKDGP
jgi:outer membrane protein OmpA-like peptidoglycan-associated protein